MSKAASILSRLKQKTHENLPQITQAITEKHDNQSKIDALSQQLIELKKRCDINHGELIALRSMVDNHRGMLETFDNTLNNTLDGMAEVVTQTYTEILSTLKTPEDKK